MHHQLGDARGKFLGVTYKIGAPIRLYYRFRNILLLSRKSYVPVYWKIRNLVSITICLVIFTIKGPERHKRIGYMLKGIYAGITKSYTLNK